MKYFYCFLVWMVVQLIPVYGQEDQLLSIKYYCTNWGMNDSWDTFCGKVKEAGYDGVETWLPSTEDERAQLLAALKKHQLALGLLSGGNGIDFDRYFQDYMDNLKRAVEFKPNYINCHTGKDYYSFEQNKKLIEAAAEMGEQHNIPVYHETHRGRFSFAAHITKNFLDKIPRLTLALDISHWCNVHESMLGDQQQTVAEALKRTGHIHARIGHPQGPQVNDPAAPEWQPVVEQHFKWWDEIVNRYRKEGKKSLTITTEFGPAGYLPTLPYTQQPLADQWQVNVYMLHRLKERYN